MSEKDDGVGAAAKILGAIDLAHAARPEGADNLVRAEASLGGKWHAPAYSTFGTLTMLPFACGSFGSFTTVT